MGAAFSVDRFARRARHHIKHIHTLYHIYVYLHTHIYKLSREIRACNNTKTTDNIKGHLTSPTNPAFRDY